MRLLAGLVSLLSVLAVGLWGAATAGATTLSGSIAMYSDPGDYIGGGTQQVWDQTAAGITGSPGDLTVNVSDDSGNSWDLEFAAPSGQTLQPGVYDHALRAMSRGSEPGIDINGAGRGCDTDAGRFEVKDIAFDSSGNPTRLWIVFEQHCEGAPAALFGEVRLGEPADGSSIQSAPSLVRWPANDYGTPETVVPVRFVASAATTVADVSVAGDDPSDFSISSDGCAGLTLSEGQVCTVYVGFVPTGPGLQTAALDVTDATGATDQVPLQGWTYGGTTRLVMNSDSGDYIGQGQSYSYSPTSGTLDATGTPEQFHFSVEGSGGDWWYGDFAPSQGQIFTTGSTWTGVARDGFQGDAPGMDVYGEGRGCNTVTGQFEVLAATYTPDGAMQTFAVKFEQHCEGAQPALTGEFDWRLNDNTPPAPWMDQEPSENGTASGGSSGGTASSSSSGAPSSSSTTTQATTAPVTPGAVSSQLLVTGLATALAQQSRRAAPMSALSGKRGAGRAQRRQALTAINRLLSIVGKARRELSLLPAPASGHAARIRALSALAAWQAALAAQQRALRSPGGAGPARMRALNRREVTRASAALHALGALSQSM
jgi:hypothetical protein